MVEGIRAYRAADKPQLIDLWRQCNLVAPWNDLEADIDLAQSGTQSTIFVASKGGRIIGSIMAGHDGHRGWLYYLGVDTAFRRRGLGSQLLRQAEAWLGERSVPKVQLILRETNLAAGNFYARNGYHPNPCRIMQRWLADRAAPKVPGAANGILRYNLTFLEMTERPRRSAPAPPHRKRLSLIRAVRPTVDFYRFLYNQAGKRQLWWERREMSDDDLLRIIHDDRVEIYVLYSEGVPAGFAELDCRELPSIEIACFGIMDQFVGQGLGDYLMHAVIDAAWSHEPEQLTMTTSSLDHHKALALYQRCGFRACRQEPRQRIDPRRNGAIDFQSL